MTHLKIEQNNGVAEEVSNNVITKLYNIVHSNNLDGTSKLKGKLHTTVTYQDYIDYLENAFKENGDKLLIIESSKIYMLFADPIIASYWANSAYGDGTGIDTATAANSVLSIPNDAFKNNTSLLTFDELGRFTNCTSIGNNSFLNCTALTSINLSNCTFIRERAFYMCSSLLSVTSLNSSITQLGNSAFAGCTVLSSIDLSNCISIGNNAFLNCTTLTSVDLSNCTTIGQEAFRGCTSLTTVGSLPANVGIGAFDGCTSLANVDFSNTTNFFGTFNGCSSLGLNQDLDMNLDGKTFGANAFRGTAYRTVTLHETTYHLICEFTGAGQMDAFGAHMPNLTKLDLSDTKQTGSTGSIYANAMTTLIYPETQTSLALKARDYGTSLLYIVCLSRNIGDISDNPGGWTWFGMPSSCAIYVQDDIFDTYMLMTGWAAQEGAGRVKKISQLPSDVTWYTKSNS